MENPRNQEGGGDTMR